MAELAVTAALERGRAHPRRRRSKLMIAATGLLALVAILAVVGGTLGPADPHAQDLLVGLSTPSWSHPFGTDELGRDILARVFAGARSALIGPLVVALGAGAASTLLGLTAGYRGGRVEGVIMRGVDLALALPAFMVVIVVAGVVGGGYPVAVLLLIVLATPWDTRIVRAATIEQRPRAYVEATTVLGLSASRTMWRHIFPNILPLVVVSACLDFAYSLVALSGLSFLGIGSAPGSTEWGRMLAENQDLVFTNPVAAIAPAAFIVLTAASLNVIGDWLYERLSERGRGR